MLRSVLSALATSDRARTATMAKLRELGGCLDGFEGNRRDRAAMLEALLHAEDVIEFTEDGKRTRLYDAEDRRALRHVRRQLECEVWP